MAEVGSPVGNFIGDLHIDLHACLMGDGGKMEHGIGGAAQRHIHGKSVHESVLCHDIAGTDVLFDKFHDLHAGMLGKADPGGVDGGNCTVALQAHTDRLCQAVHGIRSVHT